MSKRRHRYMKGSPVGSDTPDMRGYVDRGGVKYVYDLTLGAYVPVTPNGDGTGRVREDLGRLTDDELTDDERRAVEGQC